MVLLFLFNRHVEASDLLVTGKYIFNHYRDLQDINYYYSTDEVSLYNTFSTTSLNKSSLEHTKMMFYTNLFTSNLSFKHLNVFAVCLAFTLMCI